jgi:tryptophanyl-tRNA synthetase
MMNPMLPNLTGKKMSATHAESTKVMLLDAAEDIDKKLHEAPWQTEANKNAFLMTLRDILIPLSEYHARPTARVLSDWQNPSVATGAPAGTCFTAIVRYGQLHFQSYDEVHQALGDGRLHIDDLKLSVADVIKKLLAPARAAAASNADWQAAEAGAYPV